MCEIDRKDIDLIIQDDLPWNKLNRKKILITGANGFLGTYIVLSLLACNEKYGTKISIYALCRNKEKAIKKFDKYINDENLILLIQDVNHEINDSYKCDFIIHAASPANPYIIQEHPYDVVKANVIAYSKLLEKAKKWGTQEIILFSSSAVYGYSTPVDGVNENYREKIDFTDYKDVYCLSKQMSEMMSVCFEKEYKITIKTLRPFVVYGPGDDLSSKKGLIDFLNDCIRDRNIVLKSKGETVRSYIYISDVIRAFFYILLKGDNGVYNIASEKNILSIKQIAEMISNCNAKVAIEYQIENKEYLKNKSKIMIGKSDKLRELGWSEKVDIREGLFKTYIWARSCIHKEKMK